MNDGTGTYISDAHYQKQHEDRELDQKQEQEQQQREQQQQQEQLRQLQLLQEVVNLCCSSNLVLAMQEIQGALVDFSLLEVHPDKDVSAVAEGLGSEEGSRGTCSQTYPGCNLGSAEEAGTAAGPVTIKKAQDPPTGAGAVGCSAATGVVASASAEGAAGAGDSAAAAMAVLPSDAAAGGRPGGPPGGGASTAGECTGSQAEAGADLTSIAEESSSAGGVEKTAGTNTGASLWPAIVRQSPAAAGTEGAAAGSHLPPCVCEVDVELLSLLAEPDTVNEARMLSGNPINGVRGGLTDDSGLASWLQGSGAIGLLTEGLKRKTIAAHGQRRPGCQNSLKDDAEKLFNAMSGAVRSSACTAAYPDVSTAGASSGADMDDLGRAAHADPAGQEEQRHVQEVEGQEGGNEQVCLQDEAAQSREQRAEFMSVNDVATLLGVLHVLVAEVPLPVGCNNPYCPAALDEPVATRKCTGCKLAVYCSDACLKEHWEEHKGLCRRVKVARKHA
jgi:hypothetical protein